MPIDRQDLTLRQREVLAALERITRRDGYPPSLRELAQEVGLSSVSSVQAHVRTLERAEMIERRAGRPRAIRVSSGDPGGTR